MSGRETGSSRRDLPGSSCVFPIAHTLLPALFLNPLGQAGPRRPPLWLTLPLRLEIPLSAWTFKWKHTDFLPARSGVRDSC